MDGTEEVEVTRRCKVTHVDKPNVNDMILKSLQPGLKGAVLVTRDELDMLIRGLGEVPEDAYREFRRDLVQFRNAMFGGEG